jgi:rifampicin phosphotransferase
MQLTRGSYIIRAQGWRVWKVRSNSRNKAGHCRNTRKMLCFAVLSPVLLNQEDAMSSTPATPLVLSLDSPSATLPIAGGKGANLSALIRAGFPTPGGLIITTAAYDTYLEANGLRTFLDSALDGLASDHMPALEAASIAIRARFSRGHMPSGLAVAIREAYLAQPIACMSVAVRSSATAEDLPDLSFAGQQDTYLNVVGPEALLRAVVDCWSSLWTARAIGYRARNGIDNNAVALAVVVQTMIDAEAAGVLFTANPLTGKRTESVIDAALGLGEALVSGQIDPDHYVVQVAPPHLLAVHRGAKGGDKQGIQALPDAAIMDLVALGQEIEKHFDSPQDIEWTWADGRLAIVQSRPITSLYPLPAGMDPHSDLRVMGSVGAFQGMLDPFTPLGQDALRTYAAKIGSYAGYNYTFADVPAVQVAGERLFIDLTGMLRNALGRRLLSGALSQVEPGIGAALREVWNDPRLAVTAETPSPRLIRRLLPMAAPVPLRLVRTLIRPDTGRKIAQAKIHEAVARLEMRAAGFHTLAERLGLFDELVEILRNYMFGYLLPCLGAGLGALSQLYQLAGPLPGGRALALEITRGLPHNVTTEMDLVLWQTARLIRGDAAAAAVFEDRSSEDLASAYLDGTLPPVVQDAIAAFLARYGMRGLAELDLGRPRWREDPRQVMEALRSYLQIPDGEQAPDAVFARGAHSAVQALDHLVAELRKARGGWRKAHRARWAARRVRALAGMRETPKFTIIRFMGIIREALLQSGADLAAGGVIGQAEDIFFLGLAELKALAAATTTKAPDLRALVAERQEKYAREKRRRQIPRLFLSDGHAFYEGAFAAQGAGTLAGSAVSAGLAEGVVRVVFDPRNTRLQPGEILVCPGTDPSWTPLFLAAGGLVMEVGGLMTHGSVVAREYGIPAVVGVHQATTRLRTGQRVRVDGSTGLVIILDEGRD